MSAGDWKEMYRAAEEGDLDLVRYHISNGINPNYQHPEILSTPLVASVVQGHTEIARYLIDNGAQIDLISITEGLTALQAARRHKRSEILKIIEAKIGPQSWYQKFWDYFKF